MARYENFIIQNKLNEYLTTKLNLSQFLTVDTSLEQNEGMVKKVHKYTISGSAETVAEGADNTSMIDVNYANVDYTVTTTQAKTSWSDEAEMTDAYYVDAKIKGVADAIVNEYNAKAIAEYAKTTNAVTVTEFNFDAFADAIAELNVEDADETGFFALVNPAMKAELRKNLQDDLKYVEAFVRAGYLGSICGVPIYTSKLVPNDTIYIADKSAVTCFTKKETSVAQDREEGTRTNFMWGRNVKVIALTDETKCVKITK